MDKLEIFQYLLDKSYLLETRVNILYYVQSCCNKNSQSLRGNTESFPSYIQSTRWYNDDWKYEKNAVNKVCTKSSPIHRDIFESYT